MRIITGSAKGTKLLAPQGLTTRPTSECAKEALFSMIQFDLEGRHILDLFAGSGQLALEALSRGAASAVLVDQEKEAVNVIKANAQKAHLFDRCRLLCTDFRAFLRTTAGKESFDIVFLDPPYKENWLDEILGKLDADHFLHFGSLVVCESESPNPPQFATDTFQLKRHGRYGRIHIYLLEVIKDTSNSHLQEDFS